MYHRSAFIYNMFQIAAKVLMIAKPLYLRSVKRANILKKGKHLCNINWKRFNHLVLMKKKNNLNHIQYIRFLAFIYPLRSDIFYPQNNLYIYRFIYLFIYYFYLFFYLSIYLLFIYFNFLTVCVPTCNSA